MNMKKKILAAAVVLTLILGCFCACGAAEGEADQPTDKNTVSEKKTAEKGTEKKEKEGQKEDKTSEKAKEKSKEESKEDSKKSSEDQSSKKKDSEKKSDSNNNNSQKKSSCYISITCKALLPHLDEMEDGKASLVPAGGVILKKTKVTLSKGDSAFDVLSAATRKYGVHMAYEGSVGAGTIYVKGINNIFEKDCGKTSGWKYKVNGSFPLESCAERTLKDGDSIEFIFALTAENI